MPEDFALAKCSRGQMLESFTTIAGKKDCYPLLYLLYAGFQDLRHLNFQPSYQQRLGTISDISSTSIAPSPSPPAGREFLLPKQAGQYPGRFYNSNILQRSRHWIHRLGG